jgi:hypothetical protein
MASARALPQQQAQARRKTMSFGPGQISCGSFIVRLAGDTGRKAFDFIVKTPSSSLAPYVGNGPARGFEAIRRGNQIGV